MAENTSLAHLLAREIEPARILSRPIDLISFAADASFYRLIPRAVVLSRGVGEIQALFRLSHEHRIPLVFRAAGTSLSGQAITDGILVDVARNWRSVKVEEGGSRVRVQPGVIGGIVNRVLKPYGAKIGPDPASINACMIGGILANNSSGMCCGVGQNAYHTLESLTFVLPSGTLIDTADPSADEHFRESEPQLTQGLLQLKAEIESNTVLYERIRHKYLTKNTTGYSLNAFIDFALPADIFCHLLIGSEGTLAFVSEAVLKTVPDLAVKYTGLLLFPDLYAACAAIVPLRDAGALALELMDRASLRSVENQAGSPSTIKLLPDGAAALLVEFQCAEERNRPILEAQAEQAVAQLQFVAPPFFTHDAGEQALLWKIRAGMFPSVGSVRKSGTTVIIEDVTFPIEHLADATVELAELFKRHGYHNAIIFGHAKDGNLHFVLTQSFNDRASIDHYARLIDDVVRLVVERYQGALKGEHGTGRNMAPFVEYEWGPDAYRIMKSLKHLVDPENLLNPGVIINPGPTAHLDHLKRIPTIEEEVDKCIECGYCESKCPSRDLTLTPRQRIVVQREIARLKDTDGTNRSVAALETDFPYMLLDTCAVDGLCATACPVGIDTGQLTKRLRSMRHSSSAHKEALVLAKRFALLERGARSILGLCQILQALFGAGVLHNVTRILRLISRQPIPLWTGDLPRIARPCPQTRRDAAQVVYFPSCISRVLGHQRGEPAELSLSEAFLTIAERAGITMFIPDDAPGVCCGVPFSSKGYDQAFQFLANRAIERFWDWSDHGQMPVVVDTSPCAYGLLTCRCHLTSANQQKFDRLQILDSVEFTHDYLLPHLDATNKVDSVVLHPVCSLIKLNLAAKLEAVAKACSKDVILPANAGCCGFAGDRGFTFPELTQSATRLEGEEVQTIVSDGYFSSSRTCEIGLTRATGRVYRSYLYLVEQATRH